MTAPLPKILPAPPSPRRLTVILWAVAPVFVLALTLLAWGMQQAFSARQHQLGTEFTRLTRYLDTQDQFLLALESSSRRLSRLALPQLAESGTPLSPPESPIHAYQARQTLADLPYSVICASKTGCAEERPASLPRWHALGNFLADFYASFWSSMTAAGPYLLLHEAETAISLGLPTTRLPPGVPPSPAVIPPEITRVFIANFPADLAASGIRWLPVTPAADIVAGLAKIDLQAPLWPDPGHPPRFFAATLFHTGYFFSPATSAALQTLTLQGHTLRAAADAQTLAQAGSFRLTSRGVLYRYTHASTTHASFLVPYRDLLGSAGWLAPVLLVLLALGLFAGWCAAQWHKRRITLPARRNEQLADERHQLTLALLEQPQAAIFMVARATGTILYANPQAQAWLLGHAAPDAQAPDSTAVQVPLPGGASELALPASGTHASLSKPVRWLGRELLASYIPCVQAGQSAMLCLFHDQTALAVCEQTLRQARQDTEVANLARNRFLAAVNHELRTPLYGIDGSVELLALTQLDDAQRRHLARIEQASATLLQLIDNILEVRMLDSGAVTLAAEPLDPRQMLQSCVDANLPAARRKGLLLFARIDTDVPACVIGDANRLHQIINNFVGNAIKFTAAGQIIVRLHARAAAPAQTELTFQVADSGDGIPHEDQPALFSLFHNPAPHHLVTQGAGLGLAINARLARLMQGKLRVTSEPGLGSSFSLTLNLPVGSAPPAFTGPRLDGVKVTLRSPHAELTETLCQWLGTLGALAQAAPTPAHGAAAALESGEVSGILLDVLMPHARRPAGFTGPYATAGMTDLPSDAADLSIPTAGAMAIAHGLQHPGAPAATSRALPPLHILVVEDNPINLETLREQLEQLGCHPTLATSGQEALAFWDRMHFDAVLTDINMPGMDGFELTRQLRGRGVRVPIFGLSASMLSENETPCRMAGMTRGLPKPVTLQTLRALLADTLPDLAAGALPATSETGLPDRCDTAMQQPDTHARLIRELDLIPDRYRQLFRDTMSTDAVLLAQACLDRDAAQASQLLHRMRGALLTMRQTELARLLHAQETAIQSAGLTPGTSAALLDLAAGIQALCQQNAQA